MKYLILKLLIINYFIIYTQESNLFLYKNPEIGLIPISLDSQNIYIRIWNEYINEQNDTQNNCLIIGIELDCRNITCNININKESNIYYIYNYEIYHNYATNIPTFIDDDLPTCKIFNLKDIFDIKDIIKKFLNKLTVCISNNNLKNFIISPQIRNNIKGGWKLLIFNDVEIPKIYPSNRFIIDTRILINPGWDFEFMLISSMEYKLNYYSIVSFKKDINCRGFPEEDSLQILQPNHIYSNNKFVYQLYSWKYNKYNNKEFNYKYPVNELTTTHYYICYYHHYNSNIGHNLGNVYFRLDPEDATQTFSLFLLIIVCTPLILFMIYIVISTKHKTSIEKLQNIILFENRDQVSFFFFSN